MQGAVRDEGFLDYLGEWQDRLLSTSLKKVIEEAGGPEHVGIFSVDMINGFCSEGPLQSGRVNKLIAPIVQLMANAYELGVRNFVLTQDSHPADAVEFDNFPSHCVRGTLEAETVSAFKNLPFADIFTIVPKLSLNSAIGTNLDGWLADHPDVTHQIVVGDCTDLCTYQLAMHLKLSANVANKRTPVILPANCIQTYDLPVAAAKDMGIPAHPGDLFHGIFLYHMALNGCQVVSSLD